MNRLLFHELSSNHRQKTKNMRKIIASTIVLIFITTLSYAQNAGIKGILKDNADNSLIKGATVQLLLQKDSSVVKSTVSGNDGSFAFGALAADSFIVKASTIGYQEYISFITLKNDADRDLGILPMAKQGKDLSVVTVVAKGSPAVQKGDTTQFTASQYKVNPDATTEDLIKKMPGITVDKDGTVTAQGEQVKKITIDGKDFFGDDATAALKNLPSEVVDKIQVFDRLSDQAQLTGFDDGNTQKAINIVTKTGLKNGQFGRVYAGYGTDDRYSAGGNVSFFKGNRRLSFVGNFNNINQQNFASQDLLGLTSTGNNNNRANGPQRGGRGGGSADNFSVGQASGISKTNAIGINYSDMWGKKISVTGSYFFNNSNNSNQSITNIETFGSGGKNLFSNQNSNTVTNNYNHRINLRMEYKIDSSNSLFIIPSINFQKNNADGYSTSGSYYSTVDSTSNSFINSSAKRNGYNIGNNIMFRHSFAKKGRTLSFGLNTVFTKNDGNVITDGRYRFYDDFGVPADSVQNQFADNHTTGRTITGNVSYTEPIGKKGQLQVSYSPSVQKNKADQQTFLYDGQKYSDFDSTLSNRFDNTITTHNGGVNYRYNPSKDEQLSFGVNLQYSKLESDRVFPTTTSVSQAFSNVLPSAMWRKKISNYSNIRLFYRGSTNFPSVTQLQDVVNLSNPLRVSSGNPSLKQAYSHFIGGRYTYTNTKTGRSFFANIFLQAANNYISNATYIAAADSTIQHGIILKQGSQLTIPVNLNGYRSLRSFFTYSMPIKVIKTNINLNAGAGYTRLPGLSNGINTITDNVTYNAGVVFASNISEYVDFNLSYNANFNNAKTKSLVTTTNNYVNQSAGLQLNLLSKKGWFIQNDISNQSYSGLSAGLNQSYWLWNAAIGRKFLKNKAAELKLSVFDLLKQNQSIVRTVTESYIQDAQSQVLQQYFMLTFTYNLKNFGKPKMSNRSDSNSEGRHYGSPPGGGAGPGF